MVVSLWFFFSSRRRHTSCALVTGVQTCALPIYPCLRLLRAEAAQSLVGQRVEQGFLVGEIAIEGSRADPDIARECPEANRDAVPFGKSLEARRDHGGPEVAMMVGPAAPDAPACHIGTGLPGLRVWPDL